MLRRQRRAEQEQAFSSEIAKMAPEARVAAEQKAARDAFGELWHSKCVARCYRQRPSRCCRTRADPRAQTTAHPRRLQSGEAA
jgi:hypothetical protein